jgi:arabinose-5-phosphate isomerase
LDLDLARDVIRTEAEAVRQLEEHIGEGFAQAGELILERTGERPAGDRGAGGAFTAAPGRLAVTGIGKAGKIGDKLVATFSSTGTPAFFLNPTDALHGDLGMVSEKDVVLILTNSGKTQELVRLVPHLRKIGAPIVLVTGDPNSPLARPENADVVIAIGELEEAGELGLAPSSSTTAMLALGDALALTVQKARRLTGERFARFHPAGELAKAAVRVRDIMRKGDRVPVCRTDTAVSDAIAAVTKARAGAVNVLDEDGRLIGIFTDGDFRRVCSSDSGVLAGPVGDHMTRDPKRIGPERLVAEAMALMRDKKINELPVVDADGRVVGLLDIQDIVGLRLEV